MSEIIKLPIVAPPYPITEDMEHDDVSVVNIWNSYIDVDNFLNRRPGHETFVNISSVQVYHSGGITYDPIANPLKCSFSTVDSQGNQIPLLYGPGESVTIYGPGPGNKYASLEVMAFQLETGMMVYSANAFQGHRGAPWIPGVYGPVSITVRWEDLIFDGTAYCHAWDYQEGKLAWCKNCAQPIPPLTP